MSIKLSLSSFAGLLRRSGLIETDQIDQYLEDFRQRAGDASNGTEFANYLIQQGELTVWQAKKLLQGKTRGFCLGKYRLLSQLGKGGMSTVYLAEHLVMRRRCAIKVLPTKQTRDPAALGRFHREAQAVAALDHPNIVRAYDVDHENESGTDIHFLVMEYVEGASLQQIVDQRGPLPVNLAANFVAQAARGLRHAHASGLIHRDIKPTNVLVDSNGTIRLLDLGLARFFDESDESSLTIDNNQRVLGTADYLSPEQAVDSHRVDARSDIYSLGCTFYFLLTGQPPFAEGTLAQRLLAHQTREPAPLARFRSDLPQEVISLVEQMMAKSPKERMPTADAVVQRLQELEAVLGEPSMPAGHMSALVLADSNQTGALPTKISTTRTSRSTSGKARADSQTTASLDDVDDVALLPEGPLGISTAKTVVSRRVPGQGASTMQYKGAPANESGQSVIDTSVLREESSSAALRRRAAESRRTTRIITCVSVAIATVFAIAGYLKWRPDSPVSRQGTTAHVAHHAGATAGNAAAARSGGPGGAANSAVPRPEPSAGEDVTVGPTGHFGSIREALEYVRSTHHAQSKDDRRIIRVTGGVTYPEAISVDNSTFGAFPQGVELICEDARPAVLAPSGIQPAVELLGVERFRLKGFRIESEAPTAIRLGGYLIRLRLEDLSVVGFTAQGLDGRSVTGFPNQDNVELRGIEFRPSSKNAIGMHFASETTPTKEVEILKCRFAGEMRSGVEFDGNVTDVVIMESLFDRLDQAVAFTTPAAEITDVVFRNNTFHRLKHGVVFASTPSPLSRDISFERNLFAAVSEAEAIVRGDRKGDWIQVFSETIGNSRLNWTGRTELAGEAAGELDLFRNEGRVGIDVPFTSLDPDQPGFLRPTLKDVRTVVPRDIRGAKQIGALPPSGG